jgi:hypothetical protein
VVPYLYHLFYPAAFTNCADVYHAGGAGVNHYLSGSLAIAVF